MTLFFSSPAFTIHDCTAGPVKPFFLQLSATERAEIGLARTPTPCKEGDGDREEKKEEKKRKSA